MSDESICALGGGEIFRTSSHGSTEARESWREMLERSVGQTLGTVSTHQSHYKHPVDPTEVSKHSSHVLSQLTPLLGPLNKTLNTLPFYIVCLHLRGNVLVRLMKVSGLGDCSMSQSELRNC